MTTMNQMLGLKARTVPRPDAMWALPSEHIGVEIEVENFVDRGAGRTGESSINASYWNTTGDGSLRNGIEFVLNGPHSGSALTEAINNFFDADLSYDISPRTSVHIHINGSDHIEVGTLRAWCALMYIIEPAVFRWVDEDRKWGGYCAPLTDLSMARLSELLVSTSDVELQNVFTNARGTDRYFGFNVLSLQRHGTLEYRYFPCTYSKATLISWIQFVMECKKTAMGFTSVEDLLVSMEEGGEAAGDWLARKFPLSYAELQPYIVEDDIIARRDALLSLVGSSAIIRMPRGEISPVMLKVVAKLSGDSAEVIASDHGVEWQKQALAGVMRASVNANHALRFNANTIRHVLSCVNDPLTGESTLNTYVGWYDSNRNAYASLSDGELDNVISSVCRTYFELGYEAALAIISDEESPEDM